MPTVNHLLVHRMTVRRRQPGKDRFNQPKLGKNDYAPFLTDEPCRLTQGRGALVMSPDFQDVVGVSYRVVTKPNIDIREVDRVDVVDKSGETLLADAIVLHVRPVTDGTGREHHREAALQVTRSGAVQQQ